MSLQHRRLRSSISSIAITGAATLATVLAAAPAVAEDVTVPDPVDTTQAPEPEPTIPAETTPDPETDDSSADTSAVPEAPSTDTDTDVIETPGTPESTADISTDAPRTERLNAAAAEGEVVADFGYRKFRVGVQVADGSFVPAGGTAGSTFEITITGEGTPEVIPCTTAGPTVEEDVENPQGSSSCPGDIGIPDPSELRGFPQARSVEITDGLEVPFQTYVLGPGETATIVQTSSVSGLETSPDTAVLSPCETGEESDACGDPFATADVLFENVGTPPDAVDDATTTDEGEAVDIDVLANDDRSIAPITALEIADDPADGRVELADDGTATYTPDADFSGEDTFTYALSTQNGTDTATVTVQVEAEAVPEDIAPVADERDEPRAAADVTSALPNAGGADAKLLGLAAALLGAGGAATALGRRRRVAADRS